MMEVDSFFASMPLYRILNVREVCPICQGLLPSILWGILLSAIPSAMFLLASIKATSRFSKFMVINWPTWLFAARALIALVFIFVGSPWLSYLATFNLAALPFDLLTSRMLVAKQRVGLALLPMLNIPLLPPYLLPAIGAAALLVRRERHQPQPGIVLGIADHAATYTPIYIMDKSLGTQTAQRDWVIRRLGKMVVTWDPRAEGNPHLLIAGASGMGKSTLMYYLIVKLISKGYPVTVIDPLGQYAVFAKALERAVSSGSVEAIQNMFLTRRAPPSRLRIRVYDLVAHGLDVFKQISGEPLIQVAEDLSYAISVVERQSLGATQHEWVIRGVMETVREIIYKEAVRARPSLWTLVDKIEREAERLYEKRRLRTYEAIMNLAVRLRLLARYLEPGDSPLEPRMLEARPGSAEGGEWGELVVVDLSQIRDDDVKAITMELLLRKLKRHIETRPLEPPERPWLIVVDEAWILMRHMSEYRSIVNEMIREVRNRGVGMILLTQRLGDLSRDALANIGTKICLRLGEGVDVNDLVEYTGCHLLREVMGQLAPHQGLIIKRLSSLERVADASMYASSADILLFTWLAKLYPDKAIWRGAEEEVRREREKTAQKLIMLERVGAVARAREESASAASEERSEGAAGEPSPVEGVKVEAVEEERQGGAELTRTPAPSSSPMTVPEGLEEPVEKLYSVVTALIRANSDQALLNAVSRLSREQLAILVAHASRSLSRKSYLRRSEPITPALHDLSLVVSENGIFVPTKPLSLVVDAILRSSALYLCAARLAESSCPACLTFLVGGRCPSCGKEVRA